MNFIKAIMAVWKFSKKLDARAYCEFMNYSIKNLEKEISELDDKQAIDECWKAIDEYRKKMIEIEKKYGDK